MFANHVDVEKSSELLKDKVKLAGLPAADVYKLMGVSEKGLPSQEVQDRLETYGPNQIREARKTSLLLKFVSNFTHLMAMLLWVGGVVALIARMPELAIAIWLVNVINGAFSFWQEFRAEKATDALKKLLPAFSRVLRDGV